MCNIFFVESFSWSLESIADKKILKEFTCRLTVLLCYFCPELMIQREYVTERMGVWELEWDVADVDKLEIKFLVFGTIKNTCHLPHTSISTS